MSFALLTFLNSPKAIVARKIFDAWSRFVILGVRLKNSSQNLGGRDSPSLESKSRFQYITSGSTVNGKAIIPSGERKISLPSIKVSLKRRSE